MGDQPTSPPDDQGNAPNGFRVGPQGELIARSEQDGLTRGDYDKWDWKAIKASIWNGAAVSATSREDLVDGPSDPQTLWSAAVTFLEVQTVLHTIGKTLAKHSEALAGEDGPWKGEASAAFRIMMTQFAQAFLNHATQLDGGAAQLAPVPLQLHQAGQYLDWARQSVHAIDLHYASEVRRMAFLHNASVRTHSQAIDVILPNGLVEVSKFPRVVEAMTNDMRKVLKTLAQKYEHTTFDTTLTPVGAPRGATTGPPGSTGGGSGETGGGLPKHVPATVSGPGTEGETGPPKNNPPLVSTVPPPTGTTQPPPSGSIEDPPNTAVIEPPPTSPVPFKLGDSPTDAPTLAPPNLDALTPSPNLDSLTPSPSPTLTPPDTLGSVTPPNLSGPGGVDAPGSFTPTTAPLTTPTPFGSIAPPSSANPRTPDLSKLDPTAPPTLPRPGDTGSGGGQIGGVTPTLPGITPFDPKVNPISPLVPPSIPGGSGSGTGGGAGGKTPELTPFNPVEPPGAVDAPGSLSPAPNLDTSNLRDPLTNTPGTTDQPGLGLSGGGTGGMPMMPPMA
ncbi:WXG100 family type VII secretion target, partial [Lentzea sp. NBRC 102530]|uniref:WXG100 family type VII secretion target n=1 Tax=Lentzea sp. NBRC 102530 TaxID=3032201 RepID=UPI0024A50B72